jgi:hypothetical protein
MNGDTLRMLLDKNPGLLNILLTGVFLPLGILWLTNRYNTKLRKNEKSLDLTNNSKEDLREQKKLVYSSLSKILFDIQQLHASLAGPCNDSACITYAINEFDKAVAKYHGVISDNMLYLSSAVINQIYTFYRQIGEMRASLRTINEQKAFDLANVSVYYSSQVLADTIIEVQAIFIKERSDLKVQFDRTQQQMMKQFCGIPPNEEMKQKLEQFKLLQHGPIRSPA